MADFLDQKKLEISDRLTELRPLVEEFHRLEAAQRALEGVSTDREPARPATRRRRSTTAGGAARGAGAASGRRGRPRGTGTRAKQALALVQESPGITIPELAERMGIKQNYLYRVLPGLEQDGLVRKEGRGWHAKDAA
jgi:predicted Rossmann fold nucleotide-binding protein DprA/Smf involved in DNA uptake